MTGFIHDDFLLDTDVACDLYHNFAKRQPILDYHCHLEPRLIADDHRFRSMTELWLEGDHYKWRAMRANGVSEDFCSGAASDAEKFQAWAQTVPYTLRNPLYHWTHLELSFPFGIRDCLLSAETAAEIYDRCNVQLASPEFTAQGLLTQYNVAVVCTTDDPVDSLEHHRRYADECAQQGQAACATRLLPTFRPDHCLAVEHPDSLNTYLDTLSAVAGVDIRSYDTLLDALRKRHAAFHEAGCRLSDHGLEAMVAEEASAAQVKKAFNRVRSGKPLSVLDARRLKSSLLHDLAIMDHEQGWVQQFHLGALRDNNSRALAALGPNTGFDSIADVPQAAELSHFLNGLDKGDRLAKTILYNLNPRDNEVFATMAGNFQDGKVAGKIQYGSAWWFLDQLDGMEKQLNALSNMGLLARFVGMLTDSRSFLSFSRHEYFRRLLCNMLGNDVRRGVIPNDRDLLGWLVKRICFKNARRFFGFSL